jgi:hypothetical protein
MTFEQVLVFGVAEALSVGAAAHMWLRSRRPVVSKVAWTPLLLVPALGPILYVTAFSTPGEQDDDQTAAETDTDSESDPDG